MVATPAQLSEIFAAEKRAQGGREGKTWEGRALITDQHRALFRLCYETAARPSEPRQLVWGNIEFLDDGTAMIDYPKGRGKNVASARTLPVSRAMADQLKAIRSERAVHLRKATSPVFCTAAGTPWGRDCYRKAWDAVISIVDLSRKLTLVDERTGKDTTIGDSMIVYDFRHTARSVLAQSPAITSDMAERFIGHALPGVKDHYVHITEHGACAAALQQYLQDRSKGNPKGNRLSRLSPQAATVATASPRNKAVQQRS